MGHNVIVQLPDEVFEALKRRAESLGSTPADVAAGLLEQQLRDSGRNAAPLTEAEREAARLRFERHFGTVPPCSVEDLDNERIDADLARAYGETHEEG